MENKKIIFAYCDSEKALEDDYRTEEHVANNVCYEMGKIVGGCANCPCCHIEYEK